MRSFLLAVLAALLHAELSIGDDVKNSTKVETGYAFFPNANDGDFIYSIEYDTLKDVYTVGRESMKEWKSGVFKQDKMKRLQENHASTLFREDNTIGLLEWHFNFSRKPTPRRVDVKVSGFMANNDAKVSVNACLFTDYCHELKDGIAYEIPQAFLNAVPLIAVKAQLSARYNNLYDVGILRTAAKSTEPAFKVTVHYPPLLTHGPFISCPASNDRKLLTTKGAVVENASNATTNSSSTPSNETVPYTFEPDANDADFVYTIEYNIAKDLYRVGTQEIKGWQNGVFKANKMQRRVETNGEVAFVRETGIFGPEGTGEIVWHLNFKKKPAPRKITIQVSGLMSLYDNYARAHACLFDEFCFELQDGVAFEVAQEHVAAVPLIEVKLSLSGGQDKNSYLHTKILKTVNTSTDPGLLVKVFYPVTGSGCVKSHERKQRAAPDSPGFVFRPSARKAVHGVYSIVYDIVKDVYFVGEEMMRGWQSGVFEAERVQRNVEGGLAYFSRERGSSDAQLIWQIDFSRQPLPSRVSIELSGFYTASGGQVHVDVCILDDFCHPLKDGIPFEMTKNALATASVISIRARLSGGFSLFSNLYTALLRTSLSNSEAGFKVKAYYEEEEDSLQRNGWSQKAAAARFASSFV